jgi:hypothetical protein
MENSRRMRRISYQRHKDEPQFKERVRERNRRYREAHPDYWRDRRRRAREQAGTRGGNDMTTTDDRIQVRAGGELGRWLDDRANRMHAGSRHIQARSELELWHSALSSELRRIRLTLAQASCIADVCNGWMLDAAMAGSLPLVYAECYDAFRIARDVPAGLNPDISSYGAKWGPEDSDPAAWEQELLGYLRPLSPTADHALRDAISRWWAQDLDPTVEGFAKVGLRVTA